MRARLIVLVVVMMLGAACGGDTGGETESRAAEGEGSPTGTAPADDDADEEPDASSDQEEEEEEEEEEDADAPESSAPPSGDSGGAFTVDGESFGGDLFNCDPSGGAGDAEPGDLELVVLSGPGEGLSIDAWHSQGLMRAEVRFNRTTDVVEEYESDFSQDADGNWTANSASPISLDGPPFIVDGNRIVGEVTLPQDVPQDANGTVDVSFDFEIPEMSC